MMKFNLTPLGTLINEMVYNTISFNESWVPANTNSLIMIGREIVNIRSSGNIAILTTRGVFNTTISTHPAGTTVYLITADEPLIELTGSLNSELYPYVLEDYTSTDISVSGIELTENLYTYGSLVSLSYPSEGSLFDSIAANISANVVSLPAPSVSDEASVNYAVTNIALTTVVKRGYTDDEQASVSYAITNIVKTTTVNSANRISDGTGIDTSLVSGGMEVTLVTTTYDDISGIDASLISGTLS